MMASDHSTPPSSPKENSPFLASPHNNVFASFLMTKDQQQQQQQQQQQLKLLELLQLLQLSSTTLAQVQNSFLRYTLPPNNTNSQQPQQLPSQPQDRVHVNSTLQAQQLMAQAAMAVAVAAAAEQATSSAVTSFTSSTTTATPNPTATNAVAPPPTTTTLAPPSAVAALSPTSSTTAPMSPTSMAKSPSEKAALGIPQSPSQHPMTLPSDLATLLMYNKSNNMQPDVSSLSAQDIAKEAMRITKEAISKQELQQHPASPVIIGKIFLQCT